MTSDAVERPLMETFLIGLEIARDAHRVSPQFYEEVARIVAYAQSLEVAQAQVEALREALIAEIGGRSTAKMRASLNVESYERIPPYAKARADRARLALSGPTKGAHEDTLPRLTPCELHGDDCGNSACPGRKFGPTKGAERGCEIHAGDPHNLCEECWKAEQTKPEGE